ncbi:MAG: PP2C family serine/threonine-protein phosphatase [Pseudomonadota bacterium]
MTAPSPRPAQGSVSQVSLWQGGGASVRGTSHRRTDKPNQDAFACRPEGGAAQRMLLAVSDGHGSAPSFRSDVGAKLAVESALDVLDWFFDDADIFEATTRMAQDIVSAWRQKVDAHKSANPLPSGQDTRSYLPYGATLICAGVTAELFIAVQIGDGDLLLGYGDGRIEKPIPDDDGLVGEQTYSLCLDDAAQAARYYILERDGHTAWPDFIFLSTDGIAKSFATDDDYRSVGDSYRSIAHTDFAAAIEGAPAWLEDVTAKGSGDDVTMCFAARKEGGGT